MQTERKLLVNPIKAYSIEDTPRLPSLPFKNYQGPSESGSSRPNELVLPCTNLNTYDGGLNCTFEDMDFPEIIPIRQN